MSGQFTPQYPGDDLLCHFTGAIWSTFYGIQKEYETEKDSEGKRGNIGKKII